MELNSSSESHVNGAKQSIFRVLVARIRHSTHADLVILAQRETDRTGRQIYVADLVREAIKTYLKDHRSIKMTLDGKNTI